MFISLDRLGKDFDKKPCALDDLTLDLPSGKLYKYFAHSG